MKTKLILRDPYVPFPWSNRRTDISWTDTDHTRRWPHGHTSMDNLADLDRKTHRGKTHAGFALDQVRPGTFCWHTPAGQTSWVTPHGTYDTDPAHNDLMTHIRHQADALIRAHQQHLRTQAAATDPAPF